MALNAIGRASAAFQTEGTEFHHFDSKFDAYINGRTQLSAQELNGLRLFNDTTKGNGASCHISTGNNGVPALFTDFTYDNIGMPRNSVIAANDDANSFLYLTTAAPSAILIRSTTTSDCTDRCASISTR